MLPLPPNDNKIHEKTMITEQSSPKSTLHAPVKVISIDGLYNKRKVKNAGNNWNESQIRSPHCSMVLVIVNGD